MNLICILLILCLTVVAISNGQTLPYRHANNDIVESNIPNFDITPIPRIVQTYSSTTVNRKFERHSKRPKVDRSINKNQTLLTVYFKECCRKKKLPPPCMKMCDFTLSDEQAQEATLTHSCPLHHMKDFLTCMSNNNDNTPCCKRSKSLDKRLVVCQPLCNPSAYSWPDKYRGWAKFFSCRLVIHKITKCHQLNYFK